MPLLFDAEHHVYQVADEPHSPWNGRVLAHVTGILQDLGFIDTRWFDAETRDRGRRVHKATELWDCDQLDMDTVDDEVRPYLEAWLRFRRERGFRPRLIEHRVWEPSWGYAGTLDRVGWFLDQPHREVILDIKTGHCPKWGGMQLGAYHQCLPSLHRKKIVVTLCPDGRFHEEDFTDDKYRRQFLACAQVHSIKRDMGLLAS